MSKHHIQNSSIPEVGSDVPICLNKPIEKELLHIMKLLDDIRIRFNNKIQEGIKRSKIFTWDKTANATIKVYTDALNNKAIDWLLSNS